MHEDIKDYFFESLPEGPGKWIVVAWGKIVNERDGAFKQEIILKRYTDNDEPSKIWDLKGFANLAFCLVNLGSLRVLSPGTIIENQKIVRFVHEYLEKREIKIDDPQALLKMPFRILYDPTLPNWERLHLINSVDKLETRLLDGPYLKVLIPCTVIADYYYYGMTYLIKAILEGRLDSKFKKYNDVYNPRTLIPPVSVNGKIAVRIDLHRKMSYKDKYKIARLAYDKYFRSKCLDIFTSITNGIPAESHVDTDLPMKESVNLSVYGVEITNKREKFFLVHSISKCSSKPPFDFVLACKDLIGKSHFEDEDDDSGQDNLDDPSLTISPKQRQGKQRAKVQLEKGDLKIIGKEKPLWNSYPEEIAYDRDQADNFPDDAAITDKDFADPNKQEEITKVLRKFGFASGLTTNPNKRGNTNILELGFFGRSVTKPKPALPTDAFQSIEKLMMLIEESLKGKRHQVTSKIRCPVKEGVDKYSAFPVKDLMKELKKRNNAEQSRAYLNYCFKNVRAKGHTEHRRIYINEVIVSGHVFYVMDVEPKYKVENENKEIQRFISSLALVFYNGELTLDDDSLKSILKKVVTSHKDKELGRWRFLEQIHVCIQHRVDQRSFDKVLGFILRKCGNNPFN